MIKGITVTLYERTAGDPDDFNNPTYTETAVDVANVLVTRVSDAEMLNSANLEGKKLIYELSIPKGDTHSWENCRVTFFGEDFLVIGPVYQYIEANIPLLWNKKVKVGRYE